MEEPTPEHVNQDAIFDGIMEKVGNNGPFQRRFKYLFNIALVVCVSMLYMNIVLAMSVPEHWCHVPGRDRTNLSLESWKSLTLPKSKDNRGIETYDSCQMYNVDLDLIVEYLEHPNGDHQFIYDHNETITCVHGYEYDRTYYQLTAVSQQNWVCDKDLYVTNTFVFNRLGEVVGTLIVGQLGDYLGRRLTFYFSAIMGVTGSVLIMTTSHSYLLFSISAVMSALTLLSLFQSPLIISMETSDPESRGKIAMWQCIGWTVGLCALPMIFWIVGDWVWFMALTSFPTLIFLCFPYYMIESPRWLANRKQFAKCAVMLNRIAKINKKDIRYSESSLEQIFSSVKEEKVYGMMSLFSHWRLFCNTILLITGRTITNIAYLTIMLNCSRMKDPFMSFFWQSLIELPAFVLGQYLADRFGRRYTNAVAFIGSAALCIPVILLVTDPELESYVVWGAISIKFFVSINFFISNLQAMEMYPTCLRQTGVSLGAISANTIGMLGPYIVLLGTNYDARYPYVILMVAFIVGAIAMLFLPETLHQKLPETLREAEQFGKNQRFWYIPRPKDDSIAGETGDAKLEQMSNLLEKLNQREFST